MTLPWSGALTRLEELSIDGYMVCAQTNASPYTSLPLPLKYQKVQSFGHDNAIVGLANINKIWVENNTLHGEGSFDEDDPEAVLLANKVKNGYVNQVSVDLGGCRIEQANPDAPLRITDWTLTSATLCADPKFHSARIELTKDPDNTDISFASDKQITMAATGTIQLTRHSVTVTAAAGGSLRLAAARLRLAGAR